MTDPDDDRTRAAPPPPPGRPAVGSVLGNRYVLRRVLGRGGMAAVWRAEDRLLQRDVAIKIFDSSASTAPEAHLRVTAEVRLLAGLRHPGIVAVFDAGAQMDPAAGGPEGGYDYLVMDLVDGETLRSRLDRGPMPDGEVAAIGAQLADALDYVHGQGVVHRDVKPANILLETDERGLRAKLTDFGVARLMGSDRLTLHGTTLGTANYLSPEQATGADVTGASDVYSLGLVLLECLTGRLAYEGHGIEAAVARLHRQPDVPAALGPTWQEVLGRMTALDPADRPPLPLAARTLDRLAAGAATTTVLRLPDHAESPHSGAVSGALVAAPGPGPWGDLPSGGSRVASGAAVPSGLFATMDGEPLERPHRRRRAAVALGGVAAAAVLAVVVAAETGSSGPAPAGPGPDRSTGVAASPTRSTPSTPPTSASRSSTTPGTSVVATRSSVLHTTAPVSPVHRVTAAPQPAPVQRTPVHGKPKKSKPGKSKPPGKKGKAGH